MVIIQAGMSLTAEVHFKLSWQWDWEQFPPYLLVNVSVSDLEESAGDGTHETDPGAKSHPAGPWENKEINQQDFSWLQVCSK